MENEEYFEKVDEHGIPIVYVQPRKDFRGGWKFYCKFCKKWHYHGKGLGPRAAHCLNSMSPYDKTGYSLALKE